MKNFITAVLPVMIIGISLVAIIIHYVKSDENKEKNCMLEGMCIGMCLGVSLATAFHKDLGLGISIGMIAGQTIGMFIKKK